MRTSRQLFWISIALLTSASASLIARPTRADDSPDFDLKDIEVHGFLSQGFIKSIDNNYLGYSQLGTFDFTETGLNFTKRLTDNLQTGLQFATERIGQSGDFTVQLDWFYADYHLFDEFGIRFGRVKLPFGLYNDTRDIDSARAPVLLPQSLYPEDTQEFLLAEDGVEVYGHPQLGSAGALDYRAYGGTIFISDPTTTVPKINVPYLVGGRLMWETPLDGFRFGSSLQLFRLDVSEVLGPPPDVSFEAPITLWVMSAEYVRNELSLAAEYLREFASTTNSTNQRFVPEFSQIAQGGYVMGAYRVNTWLEPALYYSVSFPNINSMSGAANQQHDISATLRFDVNRFWLVKLEGHYMNGTAGLSPSLNNNTPIGALNNSWGAFLVKTTAYF